MNKLIPFLRENSRVRLAKVARKLKIPPTTAYFYLDNLHREIIKRYVTLVDFEKLGYFRVLLIAEGDGFVAQQLLDNEDSINNLLRTNRGIVADCLFKSKNEKDNLIRKLRKKMESVSSHPVLSELKIEDFQFSS